MGLGEAPSIAAPQYSPAHVSPSCPTLNPFHTPHPPPHHPPPTPRPLLYRSLTRIDPLSTPLSLESCIRELSAGTDVAGFKCGTCGTVARLATKTDRVWRFPEVRRR